MAQPEQWPPGWGGIAFSTWLDTTPSSLQQKRPYPSTRELARVPSAPVITNLRRQRPPIQFIGERCLRLRVEAICTSEGRNQSPRCSGNPGLRTGSIASSNSLRLSGSSISDSLLVPSRLGADPE